jgi:hypothetical protein
MTTEINDLVQIDKPDEIKDRPDIRFQFFNRPATDAEKFFQVSKTVPDQSMTVRELLERNKRGLPLTGEGHPLYHGDEDYYPNLKTMDLSEIAELRDSVQRDIEQHRAKLKEYNDEIQKAEAERAKLELFRQWKEEEEQKSKKPII